VNRSIDNDARIGVIPDCPGVFLNGSAAIPVKTFIGLHARQVFVMGPDGQRAAGKPHLQVSI
jgi:hypothetical protein